MTMSPFCTLHVVSCASLASGRLPGVTQRFITCPLFRSNSYWTQALAADAHPPNPGSQSSSCPWTSNLVESLMQTLLNGFINPASRLSDTWFSNCFWSSLPIKATALSFIRWSSPCLEILTPQWFPAPIDSRFRLGHWSCEELYSNKSRNFPAVIFEDRWMNPLLMPCSLMKASEKTDPIFFASLDSKGSACPLLFILLY